MSTEESLNTFAQPTPKCTVCKETGTITLTAEQAAAYDKWQKKEGRIQDLLGDLSDEDREQLMTGTHSDCWDAQFAPTECADDCDGSSHPGLWCR